MLVRSVSIIILEQVRLLENTVERAARSQQFIDDAVIDYVGINHLGLHVENMAAATSMFKQRGANVGETRTSATKAILSNITDPNGVRIELAELPPESLHRQAMERWK